MGSRKTVLALFVLLTANVAWGAALDFPDEFKIKREPVFEFAQKPRIEQDGDRVTIRFETKAYCDVTVAIEDGTGTIVRHLASGVLGPNAPKPFQKNSKSQTILWDGKNDFGEYIDDKENHRVRVSLGLKAQFERNLFTSPYKRWANAQPLLQATPEGVFYFEGRGCDHVRVFSRTGDYLRTVYPFPADKLAEVKGLKFRKFPQTGKALPVRPGFLKSTLLTSGTSSHYGEKFGTGYAATAMAVRGDRIALCYDYLNRLATDGSTGGRPLTGPQVGRKQQVGSYGGHGGGGKIVGPSSAAFSPDGRTLYLTGYNWATGFRGRYGRAYHGVLKLDFEKDEKPVVFAGQMQAGALKTGGFSGGGSGAAELKVPMGVAVDAQGRVYVADHLNDRVQVYDPSGRHLKSIASHRPVKVFVNPKNGELWVFSWGVLGITGKKTRIAKGQMVHKTMLRRYGPFENPKPVSETPLPVEPAINGFFLTGSLLEVAVDWWAEQPAIWVTTPKYAVSKVDVAWSGMGVYHRYLRDPWFQDGLRILVEEKGKWVERRNFAADARKTVLSLKPQEHAKQLLYANPTDGMLYIGEHNGYAKSFYELIRVDPENGKVSKKALPFDCEDLCFDRRGMVYMRTDTLVARYDFRTMREVPWDYGEERRNVYFDGHGPGRKVVPLIVSALPTPGNRPVCWHQGGMDVSAKGLLVVSCANSAKAPRRSSFPFSKYEHVGGKPYSPPIYPGRVRWQETHVWDRHGKPVHEDAMPGLGMLHGAEIDDEGFMYTMAGLNRYYDGKPYPNPNACTVIKFKPGKLKVLSSSGRAPVPLPKESRPKRPLDGAGASIGQVWVEGAEWMYGGVGFNGFNAGPGGGCDCWTSRFDLDDFARSFAPEVDHNSVAVLDRNGNLILRVGRYGNYDDGMPLVKDGASPRARSLGGDEVGLFHAQYVGTHTDRRLYIADAGNMRILGVKLSYHASEEIRLKDVADK